MSLRLGLRARRCWPAVPVAGPSRLALRAATAPRLARAAQVPVRAYMSSAPRGHKAPSTPARDGAAAPSAAAGSKPHTHAAPGHTHSHNGAPAAHSHDHSHDGHDHAHGLFHSHDHTHSDGAEQIIQAIRTGKLDRGTKITLLGLGSNIALTVSKGLAGLFMNSASLLAEAGHSLSDLLGDFVTLATWRISRKPPDDRFPWGYAKFETCGTLAVSVILVGGAIGIGLHSYHLLMQVVLPTLEALPPDSMFAGLQKWLPKSVPSPLLEMFHAHGVGGEHAHDHGHDVADAASAHGHVHDASTAILNPHAAWFALASVLVKEWLYQLTSKVAKQENSPVLHANALHHRADALTSLVALGSIVGSSLGGVKWLDPVGGLAVSFFILQQGLSLSKVACTELLDVGIDAKTKKSIEEVVDSLVDGHELLGCRNVRGVRSGGQIVLDLTIVVPGSMSVLEGHEIETRVRDHIMSARRDIREVKVHVHAEGSSDGLGTDVPPPPTVNSDFTRHGCEPWEGENGNGNGNEHGNDNGSGGNKTSV